MAPGRGFRGEREGEGGKEGERSIMVCTFDMRAGLLSRQCECDISRQLHVYTIGM